MVKKVNMTKKYQIVEHKSRGIKVFVMEGYWSGMFIVFDNFNEVDGKGKFSYEIAGVPTHLMHLLKEDLTEQQEQSMMLMINEIASELFQIIGNQCQTK